MRFSNPVDFRRVEDYSSEPKTSSKRSSVQRKTPLLNPKKNLLNENLQIPNFGNDYLPLEDQIQELMRPITNLEQKAQNIRNNLIENESYRKSAQTQEKKTPNSIIPARKSKIIIEVSSSREFNSQPGSTKAVKEPKHNVSLPPIKENDPFLKNQVMLHWHYHEPTKFNSSNSRINMNGSDFSESYRNSTTGSRNNPEKSLSFINKIKRRSPVKTLDPPSNLPSKSQRSDNIKSKEVHHQNKNGLNSLPLLGKESPIGKIDFGVPSNKENTGLFETINDSMIAPGDKLFSRKINYIKQASNETNNILNPSPVTDGLDTVNKSNFSQKQIGPHVPANGDKRSLNQSDDEEGLGLSVSKMDMSKLTTTGMKKQIDHATASLMSRKSSNSPLRKKEFYNRWFVPVKYWNVPKETNYLQKKYEQLKKNKNYFYYNIHDYGQNEHSPMRNNEQKTEQQISFEMLQEKLRQNATIKRYKKQLEENNERIPNFLRAVGEE